MMELISFIILLLFLVDITFTYLNISKFRKLYPKKDPYLIELNPLLRFLWKKLGLLKGGIVGTIIQIGLLFIIFLVFNRDTLLVLMGAFLMVILIHLDNFILLLKKQKKKINWRKYAFIILIGLSFIDLGTTAYYLNTYKAWRPDVPLNQMENNPLLIFLINALGLNLGLVVGALIIWFLLYIIAKKAHWFVCLSVAGVLFFGSVINSVHIKILIDLIRLYPLGYMP